MSFSKLNAKYPTFYFNAQGLMVSMIDSTFFTINSMKWYWVHQGVQFLVDPF